MNANPQKDLRSHEAPTVVDRLEHVLLIMIAAALLIGGTVTWQMAHQMDLRGRDIQQGIRSLDGVVQGMATEMRAVSQRLIEVESVIHQSITIPADDAHPSQNEFDLAVVPYRVRPGDTLWQISDSLLGSPHYYRQIAEFNNIATPSLIRPGERLLVPLYDQGETSLWDLK